MVQSHRLRREHGRPPLGIPVRVQDHCAGRLRGGPGGPGLGLVDLPRPPAGADRLRLWADTWSEPFFAREDLRGLRHACGARTVADPVLAKPQVRVDEVAV
ncbi:hypothetical protein OG594_00910 [Streptomyces sp. NBC_01214]|uniref:hypothetical protein n=1 Tax=Streptomyces sp. NBC_01214 TaxID=2903777 RepID=UPI0022539E61|nr:hypothetical protein [Streptomyces sp. NBC_01214]MCX4800247.1 hypothetical protein [Streptomyces sp. NBC_01214]